MNLDDVTRVHVEDAVVAEVGDVAQQHGVQSALHTHDLAASAHEQPRAVGVDGTDLDHLFPRLTVGPHTGQPNRGARRGEVLLQLVPFGPGHVGGRLVQRREQFVQERNVRGVLDGIGHPPTTFAHLEPDDRVALGVIDEDRTQR